jgi:hypothetical protein
MKGTGIGAKIATIIGTFLSTFVPVYVLYAVMVLFIGIDFWTSSIIAKRNGKKMFDRVILWSFFYRIVGVETLIFMMVILDDTVFSFTPHMFLSNLVTGFFGIVEIYMVAKNFWVLTNWNAFNAISDWGKNEIKNRTGIDADGLENKLLNDEQNNK